MPLDDFLTRKDWIAPRQDRWTDILPESWQTAINTSPTLNALARYMNRPSFEEGVRQWQDSIPGNSPIDRIADRKSTLAQEFPQPMNPLGQSLMETGGFLANFIGPGAKLPQRANFVAPNAPAAPKPQGIRAYHGSPHDFDKFDISKIGTGEGAQAYGRGLYFAESEGVAKSYRDNVKDMGRVDAINKRLSELAREMTKLEKPGQYRQYREPRGYELAAEYDRLMDEKLSPPSGRMYEVRINADPEHFLNYDQIQQTPHVTAALAKLKEAGYPNPLHLAGSSGLEKRVLEVNKAAVEAGIPGIKYKDQMSRGTDGGTSNYVVFDAALIEILRKYGLLPPIAAGSALMGGPSDASASPAP